MEENEQSSERVEIEEYLKEYCIEECLDEVLNKVIAERPKNPYISISKAIESKTLPEIIEIKLSLVIVGGQRYGVQAKVLTNISSFYGTAAYRKDLPVDLDFPKEFTGLEESIKGILSTLDLVKLNKIDEAIALIPNIDQAETLAISIACAKAAARHKGIATHQFISETIGLRPVDVYIPCPVFSILSRIVSDNKDLFQVVTLTPTNKSTSFESVMSKIIKIVAFLNKNELIKKSLLVSSDGSHCLETENINILLQIVKTALFESTLSDDFQIGLNLRASSLKKDPIDENASIFTYSLDGNKTAAVPVAPPPKAAKGKAPVPVVDTSTRTGSEVVDFLGTLWQENELVSIHDPLFSEDVESLKLLKKKVQDIVSEIKASKSDKLKYCISGVGGDLQCYLQVFVDSVVFDTFEDMEAFAELPFNAVKLQLGSYPNVSSAIQVCKKTKKCNLPLIVSCCDNNLLSESEESFISDFAVGAGTGQFLGGGLLSTEFYSKYNRLAEINREFPSINFVGNKFRSNVKK